MVGLSGPPPNRWFQQGLGLQPREQRALRGKMVKANIYSRHKSLLLCWLKVKFNLDKRRSPFVGFS